MEAIPAVILGIILLLFIGYNLVGLVRSVFQIIGMALSVPKFVKLPTKYLPYLRQHINFYNQLEFKDKLEFERRVYQFIMMKAFIPRGGLKQITPEMKAIIAGSAIQITFGYPKVYLSHFSKILVYPDNYYSKITRQYHAGEVNLKGIIIFSMKGLIFGHKDKTDGINLGLHEMAHALVFENRAKNSTFDFIDRKAWNEFKDLAEIEISGIQQGRDSFFRSYAGTNLHEFFAASVECFFEIPQALFEYNKDLYFALSKILKQDILEIKESA